MDCTLAKKVGIDRILGMMTVLKFLQVDCHVAAF
jgi:hypothetical protein